VRQQEGETNEPTSRLTAKEITPIAEKTPGRMNEKIWDDEPLSSGSTAAPRKTTEKTMIIMETIAVWHAVSTETRTLEVRRGTERTKAG
jgi:hypothetical protein